MPDPAPKKILIVQPNWVGDAVMATPMLRAVRQFYPDAHIAYLMRRYVKPMYTGLPYADQLLTYRTGKTKKKAGKGMFDLATRLRHGHFDLAILLPNSFKSALLCKMAGIPRIVGYERDGRSFLLTDKLLPIKHKGKFVPSPIVHYYLGLAHYLGSNHRDLKMELFVTPTEKHEAQDLLTRCGLDPNLDRPATHATTGPTPASSIGNRQSPIGNPRSPRPLIMLNPGAQYGAAKCWLPEYFAELGDRLVTELGATILISSAPKERQIVDKILAHMKHPAVDLAKQGMSLGALKDVVRRCDLMVTNDTGPRHIAAAFDVPVVTVFGPTHPEWTEIYYAKERQVAVKVFCGPCQKKTCPLDHRCMTLVTPGMVLNSVTELLGLRQPTPA
jgi:heptosyltransferase-2